MRSSISGATTDLAAQNSIAHQQLDTQAALVEQVSSGCRRRSGADRSGAAAAELLQHPVADRRPRRNAPRRCRQHRASDRHDRDRHDQPDPPDLGRASRCPRPRSPRFAPGCDKATSTVIAEDGDGQRPRDRQARGDRQPDQRGDGDHRLQGVFDNADEALWPGQFVNVRLLLQVRRSALTVPVTAVVHGTRRHLCLRHRRRPGGAEAADQGWLYEQDNCDRQQRARRRRAGRHRRPIPDPGRKPRRDSCAAGRVRRLAAQTDPAAQATQ